MLEKEVTSKGGNIYPHNRFEIIPSFMRGYQNVPICDRRVSNILNDSSNYGSFTSIRSEYIVEFDCLVSGLMNAITRSDINSCCW